MKRKFWLMKTEPEEWSWREQLRVKSREITWDGVRNYQASNNLKKMKKEDRCFFYHTGSEKKIIGIVKVSKEAFPDKTDESKRFVSVKVKAIKSLKNPVSLKKIKKINIFKHLPLVNQPRLSVMEIDLKSWKSICKIGKVSN